MAFRRIVWFARAKSDLSAILEYFYIRNGNKSYSRKLNLNIRKAIRLLRTYPGIGTRTDIQDVRALIHGNYIIFYEINPGSVVIIVFGIVVRILKNCPFWTNRQLTTNFD